MYGLKYFGFLLAGALIAIALYFSLPHKSPKNENSVESVPQKTVKALQFDLPADLEFLVQSTTVSSDFEATISREKIDTIVVTVFTDEGDLLPIKGKLNRILCTPSIASILIRHKIKLLVLLGKGVELSLEKKRFHPDLGPLISFKPLPCKSLDTLKFSEIFDTRESTRIEDIDLAVGACFRLEKSLSTSEGQAESSFLFYSVKKERLQLLNPSEDHLRALQPYSSKIKHLVIESSKSFLEEILGFRLSSLSILVPTDALRGIFDISRLNELKDLENLTLRELTSSPVNIQSEVQGVVKLPLVQPSSLKRLRLLNIQHAANKMRILDGGNNLKFLTDNASLRAWQFDTESTEEKFSFPQGVTEYPVVLNAKILRFAYGVDLDGLIAAYGNHETVQKIEIKYLTKTNGQKYFNLKRFFTFLLTLPELTKLDVDYGEFPSCNDSNILRAEFLCLPHGNGFECHKRVFDSDDEEEVEDD
jgi:hypothetical protein